MIIIPGQYLISLFLLLSQELLSIQMLSPFIEILYIFLSKNVYRYQ